MSKEDQILAALGELREEVATLRLAVNKGRVKYTVAQAGKRLGVSERTLHRLFDAGDLRRTQEGARVYILEEDIRDYEDRARRAA